MGYERNRPLEPSFKAIDAADIYEAIKKCESKRFRVTYCSLRIDGRCMNIKTIDMKIKKIYQNSEFIEGTILIDNKPVEDIFMKTEVIQKIECITDKKPDDKPEEKLSIYDMIKYCNGIVKITQCSKLEKGKCVQKTSFTFVVTHMDKKDKVIKGYKISEDSKPQFTVIDENLILDIDCINKKNTPNFPWWIIPSLINTPRNR